MRYVNDHGAHAPNREFVVGILEKNYKGEIKTNHVALHEKGKIDGVYCLNHIYKGKDGKPHLSTCSVGPNLEGTLELVEQIRKFNEDYKEEHPGTSSFSLRLATDEEIEKLLG